MVKRSKQRDAIMNQLQGRTDHPTAETLYAELKETMPNLGIATVYRNLKQLEEWGDIAMIQTDGAKRYDYNPVPHSHFFCTECGAVLDLDYGNDEILRIGQNAFGGEVTSCVSNFYGRCSDCINKLSN